MATPQKVPPDDQIRAEAANGHKTQTSLAVALGIKRTTLASYLIANPDLRQDVLDALNGSIAAERDELTVSKELPSKSSKNVDPDSDQVRAFCKERGIDTDEFVPVSAIVKRYPIQLGDGRVEEADYLSVTTKRKTGMTVLEVAPAPKVRKVTPLKPRRGEPEVTVLMGCDQAPYHDEQAHELVCGLLAMLQPHRAIHLGDLLDFPSVSKYKANPEFRASVRDCHVAAHRLLLERTQASPGTRWDLLPGNHDHRLPDFLRSGMPSEVADLAPVGESDPWWHPRRMLHLDALGVNYVDPVGGQWERAQVQLAPTLVARHGWRTGKAVAARQTAQELGVSVVTAHTHRQALTPVTIGRDGVEFLLWAMEVGCLCAIGDGFGYIPGIADWQQGVGIATVWPDGSHAFEHAQIVDGALRWRGQSYTPRHLKAA